MKNTRNTRKNMNNKMAAFLGAATSAVLTLTAVSIVTVASRINSDEPVKSGVSAVTTQVENAAAAPAAEKKEAVTTAQIKVPVADEKKAAAAAALTPAPTAEKKEVVTAAQVQAPAAEKKEVVTAAQVQASAAEKKEAVTASQVQTPSAEKKEAVTASQVQAPAAEKKEAVPAVKKQDTLEEQLKAAKTAGLYVPEGEVNDWKIHSAKDGFPVGTYFCGDKTLYVQKVNNALYNITVKVPTGDNTATVYVIKAYANGSKMYYSNAAKTAVTFNADGNAAESKTVDTNHNGTFDASDAGYTWIDTEGTTIFVPWVGFPYWVK